MILTFSSPSNPQSMTLSNTFPAGTHLPVSAIGKESLVILLLVWSP
ncbi:hypothetical protein LINPERPRIM_LOCUS1487 [Linum perenne]